MLSRCLAVGARAFVIDRAGHYEMLTPLVPGAQQIEIGADDSPYALNPWDVPDPAKVSREKLAFLLALHQVMMGGLDAPPDRAVGRRDPRRVRQGRGVAGQPRRASRCCRTSCAPRPRRPRRRTRSTSPRRCATSPTGWRSTAGEGTYAYLLDRETTVPARRSTGGVRHPPLPGVRTAAGDVSDHGVRHQHRRAPLGGPQGRGEQPGRPAVLGRSIMLMDEAWHLISRPETGAYANNLARRARHLGADVDRDVASSCLTSTPSTAVR